jgi:RNA polymerase sigma factor, sigma-70 family
MYVTAIGILRNKEDAEDAIQNALMQGYDHLDDLRFFDKIKPWILRILVNECYKILKKRMYTVDIEELEVSSGEDTIEQKTILWESVLALEMKYRTVIILYYYENMPVKDMAKVLGITVDAVKQRLFRARKMLREILESEAVL